MSFTKQLIKEVATTRNVFGCEPKKLKSIDKKECKELVTLINQCKQQNRGKYYSNGSDYRIFDLKDDIRKFTNATEILREGVMLFVNEIGHICHGIVDRYSGAANKNVGDAFLFVWKLD